MRFQHLSRDDVFRLIDAFDLWMHDRVGREVTVRIGAEDFLVVDVRAREKVVELPPLEETDGRATV